MSRISIDWSYATASYITLTPIVVRSSRKTMTGEYHSSGQLAAWMVRSCGGVMGTVPVEDGCATGRLSRVLMDNVTVWNLSTVAKTSTWDLRPGRGGAAAADEADTPRNAPSLPPPIVPENPPSAPPAPTHT
ncbi:MAG: hypothetical protein ACK5MB_14860, partial [Phycisphaerales bacterium]